MSSLVCIIIFVMCVVQCKRRYGRSAVLFFKYLFTGSKDTLILIVVLTLMVFSLVEFLKSLGIIEQPNSYGPVAETSVRHL